jgi:hypothetical protein
MLRTTKRFLIAVALIIIFGLIATSIRTIFFKTPETCSDGIKNQNEEAIDCGGVCGACAKEIPAAALEVVESTIIYGGPGHSDILVKVHNPNDSYGGVQFSYTVSLKDASGAEIAKKTDTSFILPKETKYLMQIGMETPQVASSVVVTIDNVEWKSLSGYQESPVINVVHKRYGPVSTGVGFGQADGTLSNESGFDFQSLTLKVILRDAAGKPIAINKTEMRTVVANEQRDFRLIWPSYFEGEVSSVETETEADVYHSQNFIRQYLPGGAFQQF